MIHNLDINNFLINYWQKKPLLIRAAFPNYTATISEEELAGLACENFVESRIITENKIIPIWTLENGPFSESHFTKLPKTHWTLLVQGLNKIFPEIDDLLHEFDFIPSWRVDDLMASYAAPEGSVGPHVDQYDVFLLQAKGRRRWMISEEPINEGDFEENIPLKLIKNFKAQSEWVLEAGDILYLPANVAHYGIGMDDCMTFSIGFRAPSHAELLSAYIDDQIPNLDDRLRYQDPKLSDNQNSGEISASAINNIQEIFLSQFNDKEKIADWFGRYITEYLNEENNELEENISPNDFLKNFSDAGYLRRPATIRANYFKDNNAHISLYINGTKINIQPEIENTALLFCNQHRLAYADIKSELSNNNVVQFLCELNNKGFIEISDE